MVISFFQFRYTLENKLKIKPVRKFNIHYWKFICINKNEAQIIICHVKFSEDSLRGKGWNFSKNSRSLKAFISRMWQESKWVFKTVLSKVGTAVIRIFLMDPKMISMPTEKKTKNKKQYLDSGRLYLKENTDWEESWREWDCQVWKLVPPTLTTHVTLEKYLISPYLCYLFCKVGLEIVLISKRFYEY